VESIDEGEDEGADSEEGAAVAEVAEADLLCRVEVRALTVEETFDEAGTEVA
jgi:hypothetical protein